MEKQEVNKSTGTDSNGVAEKAAAEKAAAEKAAAEKAAAEKAAAEKAAKKKKEADGTASVTTEKMQAKALSAIDKDKLESKKKTMAFAKQRAQEQKKEKDAQVKESKKGKKVKLKALVGLAGHYNLPYAEGHIFSINENKAAELLENKHAEKVK